ncbi:MAG TPA: class I SAM-dependent methyltransferase [Flavitalea sp.]|nr:class I SAM-dependent methyltransferase [Flavitalea sp.]
MDRKRQYDIKTLAEQLRFPNGELGIKVGVNMNKGNRLMNLETIIQLNIGDNESILEIGMGNGYFVKDVLSSANNIKYTGCDFSNTMIKEASLLNISFAAQSKFIQAKGDQLPFDDNYFDKVFTVNTIYFWDEQQCTLGEFRRVLKTGGVFIVTFRPKIVMNNLPVVKYGFTLFSKEDVMHLLSQNGFDLISATEIDDTDIIIDEQAYKNSFIVIKALKLK